MQRVFEVGPVFRAENSHTHRHLCEFTGLDLEMQITDSYTEVLGLLHRLMTTIFRNVSAKCKDEIEIIRKQFDLHCPPDVIWTDDPVIINF